MDVTTSGAIGKKTYVEVIEIFELLAKRSKKNSHGPSRAQERANLDKITSLVLKIDAMIRKLG